MRADITVQWFTQMRAATRATWTRNEDADRIGYDALAYICRNDESFTLRLSKLFPYHDFCVQWKSSRQIPCEFSISLLGDCCLPFLEHLWTKSQWSSFMHNKSITKSELTKGCAEPTIGHVRGELIYLWGPARLKCSKSLNMFHAGPFLIRKI